MYQITSTTSSMEEMIIQNGFSISKAEAFASQLLETLNKSFLSLMISIGHRTGMFDVLSDLPPATSKEIADEAKLYERYVREWPGAMVTSGVIHFDPEQITGMS
jgi:hypothetical protein